MIDSSLLSITSAVLEDDFNDALAAVHDADDSLTIAQRRDNANRLHMAAYRLRAWRKSTRLYCESQDALCEAVIEFSERVLNRLGFDSDNFYGCDCGRD